MSDEAMKEKMEKLEEIITEHMIRKVLNTSSP